MCGIAGFLHPPGRLEDARRVVVRMTDAIEHRGPDDAGSWTDPAAGVALGHRRLSVLDLSAAGHQPMQSANQRFVLVYNGEIYNHAALRLELEHAHAAPDWRGHSDTETLLAGFERWGVEATLRRTVGMFAIALWDRRDATLFLARDRFGEKPLYYGWCGSTFVFGSELKALRAHPAFSNPISRTALGQFFRFMYVPAPASIHEGVYKLEPGCLLRITGRAPASAPSAPLRAPAEHGSLSIRRWWSLEEIVRAGSQSPLTDEAAALDLLEECLREAVTIQSLADVPIGAFLSGGIDSSLVVALLQQQASRPVRTFTIGFDQQGYDESAHARAVAARLGTDHTEIRVTPDEARALIPALPTMYDEPFADSSQIPTHLVCRAARGHVTVALSGDAGDELFGGYNRYLWATRIWNRVRHVPHPLRQVLATSLGAIPAAAWDGAGHGLNRLMPGSRGIGRLGEKAHKLGGRLRHARSFDEFYLRLVSEWQDPAELVLGQGTSPPPGAGPLAPFPVEGITNEQLTMMYRDSLTYLPDDILCKVDRAAMAVSLETRVPLLDHRVAEVAWRLPISMKIRGREGKWALRQLLYRHVPRELMERPKSGFAIPLGDWLRGPLAGWAGHLLERQRIEREGYLNPASVAAAWREHLRGGRDATQRVWSVLMFQSWLEAAR